MLIDAKIERSFVHTEQYENTAEPFLNGSQWIWIEKKKQKKTKLYSS